MKEKGNNFENGLHNSTTTCLGEVEGNIVSLKMMSLRASCHFVKW